MAFKTTATTENFAKYDILEYSDRSKVKEALKDLVALSGSLKDLGDASFWREPQYVYETLKTFKLILDATNTINEDSILGVKELVYRYERVYGESACLDIPKLIRLCQKFNWVTYSTSGSLKFTVDGKRMVLSLFRIANDSLVYHATPDDLKYISLANRDIEIAGAYEDRGVGSYDVLASIISNLEEGINDIERQGEMYIDDGTAIQRYEGVFQLLQKMEEEVQRRYDENIAVTITKSERNRIMNLHNRAYAVFQKAFSILSKFLGNVGYASQFILTNKVKNIDTEQFLNYLVNVYADNVDEYYLDTVMVLEYMESLGDEVTDSEGEIFVTFTLPPLLHEEEVGIGQQEIDNWIERWQPPEIIDMPAVEFRETRKVSSKDFEELLKGGPSISKIEINTEPLVNAVRENSGDYIDKILKGMGSQWHQAINNLTLLSMLHQDKEVEIHKREGERIDLDESKGWKLIYPNNQERYVKATKKLGSHLKKRGIHHG